MKITLKRAVIAFSMLIAAVPLAGLLVAQSGFYSVAASVGHTSWVNWFLRLGMTQSVALHSDPQPTAVDLSDKQRIQLGAAHFQGGCAPCHGAPGTPINPLFQNMLPAAPKLAQKVPEWEPGELFWIVQNGLKYTGMPFWSGSDRPDEIWSVVAFLQALPGMGEQEYVMLAKGNTDTEAVSATQLANEGAPLLARTACDRCHDTVDALPASNRVPMLAGQSVDYLARTLIEYREGSRSSGIMQPIAAVLDDAQINALAEYYATVPAPAQLGSPPQELFYGEAADADGVSSDAVNKLVYHGSRKARIPACIACHGDAGRSDYPKLGGQSAAYLAQQLRLWKRGGRSQTAWGGVMAAVAKQLDEQQIISLSDWFAGQATSQRPSP